MSRSVIIYGPPGCGKTHHAETLRKRLGLDRVQDGWDPFNDKFNPSGVLYLTNVDIGDLAPDDYLRSGRIMTFQRAKIQFGLGGEG